MSAETSIRKNGMAEFASLEGTSVWWGGAQVLKRGASIDDWKVASGLDWRVKRGIVRFNTPSDDGQRVELRSWEDRHVLFRSDTKAPLSVVSDGFKVVQPYQALEFFRDLCEHNGFQMRTAGALSGGRRYWAMADIGEESYILDPRDRVKGRLLMATACDGSMHSIGKFVSECVVCANTLGMALREDGKQVKVSHRSVFNADDVKAKLGLASGQWNLFIEQARMLAKRPINAHDASGRTLVLLNGEHLRETGKAYEAKVAEIKATRGYKRIMDLFTKSAMAHDMPGRKDTAWGWLNAVTEYVDHHIGARSAENRLNSAQFGPGDELKSNAMKVAMELV